jgi:hypothetical protein
MTDNAKSSPSRRELLFLLGDIAAQWRESKNPRFIKEYHDTYHQLRGLGWSGMLDIEAELPDEYMPRDYLERSQLSQTASD